MEIWKTIERFGGAYEISSLGRLRRVGRNALKKLTVAKNGYLVANLWHMNKGVVVCIHHLVAEHFIGPRPDGAHINHKDGVKTNPLPNNLEYVTPRQNSAHAIATGLCNVRGEHNPVAKLSEADVREIRRRLEAGDRGSDVAREFGVKPPIISQIKHRTRWAHLS